MADEFEEVKRERDHYMARVHELERQLRGYVSEVYEVEQRLGKALGYPWFKDDLKNFPKATKKDGVNVNESVGVLAWQAAQRINSEGWILTESNKPRRLSFLRTPVPVTPTWDTGLTNRGLSCDDLRCGMTWGRKIGG